MGEVVDVVIDPFTKEKVRAELPPTSRTAPEDARRALRLGPFVDVTDPEIARAVVLLDAVRALGGRPRIALFGGGAHRLLCPSSNDATSGLRRPLHDLDLACRHRETKETLGFLRDVGARAGSRVSFFELPGDRRFNTLSGGYRYRFHDLGDSTPSNVELGTLDVVADEFRFCHRFPFADDLEHLPEHTWTLPPALLLLAKLQFIRRIPASDAERVRERVLEPFGRREVVIGPETKDVQDVVALLHDLDFGDGPSAISLERIRRLLADDWGFWTTVRLNLGLVERSPVLARTAPAFADVVRSRLARLRDAVGSLQPRRRLAFLKGQWWEEVDEVTSTETASVAP